MCVCVCVCVCVCCGSASASGRVRRPRICAAADADAAAAGKYISAVLCATATASNWLQCSIVSPLRSQVVVVSPSCREMATTDGVVSAATVGKLSTIERVVKSECVCPSVRLSVCHIRRRSRCRAVSQLTCAILCRADRAYSNVTDGRCLSVSWSVTAGPAVY